jgi:hypothetical protein
MPVSFFAVVADSEGERSLRHVVLNGEVQDLMSLHFQQMHSEFLNAQTEQIAFGPCFHPDEDQVFVIRPFTLPTFMTAVSGPAVAVENLIDQDLTSGRLKALIGANRDGAQLKELVIQGIDGRQLLKHSRINLIFEKERFSRLEQPGLTIGDNIVAVLKGKTLFFKNFQLLRRIFDLTEYFQEATDEQLKSFLGDSNFYMKDIVATVAVCDSWIRKKVFSVLDSGILEACSAAKVVKIAKRYGVEIELVEEHGEKKILLKNDRKYIKNVIRLLDEDFLDSSLTDRSFLVNSKLALNAS